MFGEHQRPADGEQFHVPTAHDVQHETGQATDIKIQAEEILRVKRGEVGGTMAFKEGSEPSPEGEIPRQSSVEEIYDKLVDRAITQRSEPWSEYVAAIQLRSDEGVAFIQVCLIQQLPPGIEAPPSQVQGVQIRMVVTGKIWF